MRPEYVKCIRDPRYVDGKPNKHALCGSYIGMEFAFVSIDHAWCEVARGGRLLPCPECAAKVVEMFGEARDA